MTRAAERASGEDGDPGPGRARAVPDGGPAPVRVTGRTRSTPRPRQVRRARASASEPAAPLTKKDYLSVLDLSGDELAGLIDLAAALKRNRHAGRTGDQPLAHRHVALLFEKPSLRTRTTFVIAIRELGGDIVELPAGEALGGREDVRDVARNLERWIVGVVVRTFEQAKLTAFAAAAPGLHVVNALTNEEHPCQVLADMLTLHERWGSIRGRTLTYVGDGNNVAASLAHAGPMLGLHVRLASPRGFELAPSIVETCRRRAVDGATLTLLTDPAEAVRGANAVYTDVWASMGQEHEARSRARVFHPYQVNDALMKLAAPGALFMHCLPAHRGHEVTDSVMDSPSSVVFDQAENRLHTQKALLTRLIRS